MNSFFHINKKVLSGDNLVVWRKRKIRSFVGQKVPGGHVKHACLPHVCLYVAVTHKHARVNLKNYDLSDLTRMGFGAKSLNVNIINYMR